MSHAQEMKLLRHCRVIKKWFRKRLSPRERKFQLQDETSATYRELPTLQFSSKKYFRPIWTTIWRRSLAKVLSMILDDFKSLHPVILKELEAYRCSIDTISCGLQISIVKIVNHCLEILEFAVFLENDRYFIIEFCKTEAASRKSNQNWTCDEILRVIGSYFEEICTRDFLGDYASGCILMKELLLAL